eukprot:TRINITY_DN6492_c0_g1_i10.p1 TRINITY_DN6492_c0_g1~~TRINITY_DN6492_c0_g1_i10.p1  ORF type:complete len:429 (+),score=83.08 TRINITY_DN6492_c0_g1_i10:470-1756(+)
MRTLCYLEMNSQESAILNSFLAKNDPKAMSSADGALFIVQVSAFDEVLLKPSADLHTGSSGDVKCFRWIPLMDVIAQSTNPQIHSGFINHRHQRPEIAEHTFHSDPPMCRYIFHRETILDDGFLSPTNMEDPDRHHLPSMHADFVAIVNQASVLYTLARYISVIQPEGGFRRQEAHLGYEAVNRIEASYLDQEEWTKRLEIWAEMQKLHSKSKSRETFETIREMHYQELRLTRALEKEMYQHSDSREAVGRTLIHSNLCEILPKLYLGNIGAAGNFKLLQSHGITHILRVVPGKLQFTNKFVYAKIPLEDVEETDLFTYFEAAKLFIEAGRAAGGCFVHCMAGISRSATLVIAYVMSQVYRTEPMSLLRSFFHTQKRRCGICPNEGFFRQLILYEKLLNDTEYSQSPIFNLFPCTQSSMVPTSHDEPK